MQSQLLHFCLHVLLVFAALVMWWPIVSPLPELPPLPAPGQMLYLFFQSLAPTIPASFLTFGNHPSTPCTRRSRASGGSARSRTS